MKYDFNSLDLQPGQFDQFSNSIGYDKKLNAWKLEQQDDYKKFTNHVIQNGETDPETLDYLLKLDQTTGLDLLFQDGKLKSNWKETYFKLRNDGKAGYFHMTPKLNEDLLAPSSLPASESDSEELEMPSVKSWEKSSNIATNSKLNKIPVSMKLDKLIGPAFSINQTNNRRNKSELNTENDTFYTFDPNKKRYKTKDIMSLMLGNEDYANSLRDNFGGNTDRLAARRARRFMNRNMRNYRRTGLEDSDMFESDTDLIYRNGGNINYLAYMRKQGGDIHIKKSHEGRFTDYCGGKVTDECIKRGKNSPSAAIRKQATFAENARHWKH